MAEQKAGCLTCRVERLEKRVELWRRLVILLSAAVVVGVLFDFASTLIEVMGRG